MLPRCVRYAARNVSMPDDVMEVLPGDAQHPRDIRLGASRRGNDGVAQQFARMRHAAI
jgi:hypothetical protein